MRYMPWIGVESTPYELVRLICLDGRCCNVWLLAPHSFPNSLGFAEKARLSRQKSGNGPPSSVMVGSHGLKVVRGDSLNKYVVNSEKVLKGATKQLIVLG